MSCTVTGALITSDGGAYDGVVVFRPAPQGARVVTSSLVGGADIQSTVAAGLLSIDLEPGYYWVRLKDTRQFKINVPASGTADISTLTVSGLVNVTAAEVGIPIGGTVGQVLTKLSGDDYDVGWSDLPT